MHRIALVGTGKLARALARSLPMQIVAVAGRDAARVGEVASMCTDADEVSISQVANESFDVLWIATSDDAIHGVAGMIAAQRERWNDIVVVHSSGARGTNVLAPFASRGARTIALHPNASLQGDGTIPPALVWGITPGDEDFKNLAASILHPVSPRLLVVDESSRTLYHAAASVASNFSVTLYAFAEELYARAGINATVAREIVGEYMSASIERCLARGPGESLTGPVARGDAGTVALQREAIMESAPELLALFDSLVELTRSVSAGASE